MTRKEALEIALQCIRWRFTDASIIEKRELERAIDVLGTEAEATQGGPPLRAV